MKTIKVLLGNRIREIRKMKGLTQEQLAELVNIEQKHVSRIELGKSAPTFERLELFSQVLDVPITDFFRNNSSVERKSITINFLVERQDLDPISVC